MATSKRYPLSTPDGQAIPLEVIKPLAYVSIPFTLAGFSTVVDLTATYLDKILVAFSEEGCYLSSLAIPVAPVSGVISPSIIYVPAGIAIAFVTNSTSLSAIGNTVLGTVHIQIVDTWAGLALETQITRR